MTDRIDLHVHTTASDGTFSPTQAVRLAASLGLKAMAVTDHDTSAGCEEAAQAAARENLELVPGIEISTVHNGPVHVLGYYTEPDAMREVLEWIVRDRDERNEKIGRKIRDNEMKRIPYMLVVGEKEEANGTVSVRKQGQGDQGSMKFADFANKIAEEVRNMTENL